MGQDSPIDAVASIVEAYVSQDLLSDAARPFAKLLVATLGQRWWMDRLINNAVNVTLGAGGEQFMLLPDGAIMRRRGRRIGCRSMAGSTLSGTRTARAVHSTATATLAADRAVQTYIDSRVASPGSYNLYSRQCSGFCEGALDAAGIEIPHNIIPNFQFEDIKRIGR